MSFLYKDERKDYIKLKVHFELIKHKLIELEKDNVELKKRLETKECQIRQKNRLLILLNNENARLKDKIDSDDDEIEPIGFNDLGDLVPKFRQYG